MKFYAVGYTNGGANEKRLGPFGSIDDAKRNGISEMNRNRGAFSFSGVVDESGKYVFTNSSTRSTNPVVQNALAAQGVAKNANGVITESDLKRHAYNFCRFEFKKIAQNLRRDYDAMYKQWMQTSIAQGAVRSGTADAKTVESYIDEYMRRLDSAKNDIEGL